MDQIGIEKKLTDIFRSLFNISDLVLENEITANDVPGWDSFNHINLIIQIEEEFGIKFTNEEVSSLENVGQLKKLVQEKML